MVIKSDINMSIYAAMNENNIDIPLPQRVVHMAKSGED